MKTDGKVIRVLWSIFYDSNPIFKYNSLGIKNFIWINSSPYSLGKPVKRLSIGNGISASPHYSSDVGGIVIYANQVGGMDDLIF